MDSGIRKSNIRNTQPILAVDIPDSGTTAEVEGIL